MIQSLIIVGLVISQVQQPEIKPGAIQIERFKKRVDFDNRIKTFKLIPGGGMIGPWPDVRNAPGLDSSWECESTERSWIFKKGKGGISISVGVFAEAPELVRDEFIAGLVNPMQQEIIFDPTDTQIGALSIRIRSSNRYESDSVRVWNHNWVISVTKWNSDVNIFAIAEWLNTYAKSKMVQNLAEYVPKPKKIEVIPDPVRVGVPIEIKITPPIVDPNRYLLKSATDGEYFLKLKHLDYSRSYRPIKSGHTCIKLTIEDKLTLLEYSFEVPINIID